MNLKVQGFKLLQTVIAQHRLGEMSEFDPPTESSNPTEVNGDLCILKHNPMVRQ